MTLASTSDSVAGRFLRQVHAAPDAPCLHLYDSAGGCVTHTYAALGERAGQWAAALRQASHKAHRGGRTRTLIILPHSFDLYAAFMGALIADVVPAILAHPSPKSAEAECLQTIAALVARNAPAAVVVHSRWRPLLETILDRVGSRAALISPDDPLPAGSLAMTRQPRGSDVAFVQYSSGTTGMKKGVAITNEAALWQVDRYGAAIRLTADDVIATWLPLYHDMGLLACAVVPLCAGAAIAALSPFDWVRRPVSLLDAITAHRATLCWLPNFAFNFLARTVTDDDLAGVNLGSLRAVINCSEPVLADSHRAFLARFRSRGLRSDVFAASYAMAESTFAVTSGGVSAPLVEDIVHAGRLAAGQAVPLADGDSRAMVLASSGAPLPDTKVVVLGPSGEALPERCIGEIAIASPSLFGGYDGADRTAVVGGLFATGDLGYLANGQLFVTGRKKDLIIVAGKNIFPQDVEAIVNAAPGIIPGRAVAFGVPDPVLGTDRLIVVAEIREVDDSRRPTIAAAIRDRLTAVDIPVHDVRLVPHMWLRKSTSGKLARGDNRARYTALIAAEADRSARSVPPTPIPAGPSPDRWLPIVAGAVDRVLARTARGHAGAIGPDERLITSGLIDSLTLVELILEIEGASNLEIPRASLDVGHFETPHKIARLISHLKDGAIDDARVLESNRVVQMDDRDKVCERYLAVDAPIDLLILGSSKAQHLWPGVAADYGLRGFNFWLRSARAEDWYCALRFVLDHPKAALKTVVLPIDVEAFSNVAGLDIRLAYSKHLTGYLDTSDQRALPMPPAARRSSERFDAVSVQFKLGETESWMLYGSSDVVTQRFDGGWAAADRRPVVIADPHDRDAQYTLRMAGFSALDRQRVKYFLELTRLCDARGITLVCCVSPLHPALDAHLTATTAYPERLNDLSALMAQLAGPRLLFADTRLPAGFGGLDDDFPNAAHIGMANSDRLLAFLLERVAGLAVRTPIPTRAWIAGPADSVQGPYAA